MKNFKILMYKWRVCGMIMRTKTFVVVTDITHHNGRHFKYRIRMLGMPQAKARRRLMQDMFSLYRLKL